MKISLRSLLDAQKTTFPKQQNTSVAGLWFLQRTPLPHKTIWMACMAAIFLLLANGFVFGQAGAALDFDGSNDVVNLNTNLGLNNAPKMTIEAWVKPDIVTGNRNWVQDGNLGIVFKSSGSSIVFSTRNSTGGTITRTTASGVLTAGVWQHVAVVFDGSLPSSDLIRIYVNGVLKPVTVSGSTTTIFSGTNNINLGSAFDGQMDEVRFWNIAKNCLDLSYYSGCELAGTETGLVAYYQFNQGTAGGSNSGETSLTDLVAVPHNGTLTNFALSGSSSNWVSPGGVTTGNACSGSPVGPEINVQGNGLDITDGSTTAATSNDTDFGNQLVCSGSVMKTYTVQNTGTADLNLTAISLSGANAADFTLGGISPPVVVSVGNSTTFTLTFDPSLAGVRNATVNIANDDCDENPYDFAVKGTGLDPEINITGRGVSIVDGDMAPTSNDHTDFQGVNVSAGTAVRTFTIQNTGNSTLNISSISLSGTEATDFSLGGISPPTAVAGGGSTTFTVTFDPSGVGLRSATVNIANDDCNEVDYEFAIQGTGVSTSTSLDFDGTDDNLKICGSGGSYCLYPLTVEAWIKTTKNYGGGSVQSGGGIIVNKYVGSSGNGWAFFLGNGGKVRGWYYRASNSNTTPITTTEVNDGNWHHVAFVVDASGGKIYIDGVLSATDTWSGTAGVCSNFSVPAIIGDREQNDARFQGQIDEVRIWSSAKTGAALLASKDIELNGTEANLISYHKFDDLVQPENDCSGYNNFAQRLGNLGSNNLPQINGQSPIISDASCGAANIGIPEINLTGNGQNIADGKTALNTSDSTQYGSICSGSSLTVNYTIQNTGTGNLVIPASGITLSGANTDQFSVGGISLPAILAPGDAASFTITFMPTSAGVKNATVNVSNNDCDEDPYNFNIQGTGLEPEISLKGNGLSIVDGDITPSATDHTDFGTAAVGGNFSRTFTIENLGASCDLLLSGSPKVTITGANAADFSVSLQPTSPITASSSTTFTVLFSPSVTGVRNATINISNNDGNENPYDCAIRGTGALPEINLKGNGQSIADGNATPSSADHTDFGATSSCIPLVRTFTIENTGDAALSVSAITMSGANAADFTVGGISLPASVATAGSSTFTLSFVPGAAGIRTATVEIANDDSGENPYDFAVQGTGADPEIDVTGNSTSIPDGSGTPNAADDTDFGQTTGAPILRTFTIENTGTEPLNVSAITFSGANAAMFAHSGLSLPANIAAGSSTTFDVTYTPTGVGIHNATVNITSDDCDEASYNFAIKGEQTCAPAAFTACPSNQTVNTDAGVCTAVVSYTATASGTPAPNLTYSFSSATTGSGNGTGSGLTFNKGVTTVTITATNSCSAPTCVFTVTVNDNQNPIITCPANISVTTGVNTAGCTSFIDEPADLLTTPGVIFPNGPVPASGTSLLFPATDPPNQIMIKIPVIPAGLFQTGDPITLDFSSTWTRTGTDNDVRWMFADGNQLTLNGFWLIDNSGGAVARSQTPSTPSATTAPFVLDNQINCGNCFPVIGGQYRADISLNVNTVGQVTINGVMSGNGSAGTAVFNYTYSGTFDVADGIYFYFVNENSGSGSATAQLDELDYTCDLATPSSCGAIVSWNTPTASDNCPAPTVVRSNGPGDDANMTLNSEDEFPLGVTNICYLATDGSGNTAECCFNVTVTDNTNPTITCPANVAANTDAGQCSASGVSLGTPATADNCEVQSTTNNGPSSYVVGNTTVTWTATDAAGNSATCTQMVTVTDNQPPTTVCQNNSVTLNASGSASITATQVNNGSSDVCGIESLSLGQSNFSCANLGANTVTLLVTDNNGNTATCQATVTVEDNTAPSITCPANQTIPMGVDCEAVMPNYLGMATASDNCSVSVTQSPAAGTTLSGNGTETVTLTATDQGGLTASCVFTLTKQDQIAPSISCPSLPIEQDNDGGQCSAVVFFFNAAAASDYCDASPNIAYSPASGSSFAVGNTTVTATATDDSGNTATCGFTVTVHDAQAPTLVCPSDTIRMDADAGLCSTEVTFSVSAADNCDTNPTLNLSHTSSAAFPVGVTDVLFTATDDAGNAASCSFVIEISDTQSPNITCPANVNSNTDANLCSAVLNFTATASDNCNASPTITFSPVSGSSFNLGTTTVIATAGDGRGNTATCSFTVTVNDNQAPVLSCPSGVNQAANLGACDATVNFSVSASDNCNASPTLSGSHASGAVFNVGSTTVTYTADDGNGNTSSCSFAVVVNDNQLPTITCPANIAQNNDANQCSAVVNYTVTASDNCGSLALTYSKASGTVFQLGATTVTATANDGHGNTATCSFTVTINDIQAPSITCPANITVNNATNQCNAAVTVPAPVVNDNCSGASFANALDFDGTNDFVNIGAPNFMNQISALTIESWVYLDAAGNASIFARQGSGNSDIHLDLASNGSVTGVLWIGSQRQGTTAPGAISTGVWTHIAMVFNGAGATNADRLKIYVNGVAQSLTFIGTISNLTPNCIGENAFLGSMRGTSLFLNGKLDDTRIWTVAKTQAQIVAAMNNPLVGNEAGLGDYYKYDQGTANGSNTGVITLPDNSGHGFNGTLNNFALSGTNSNWVTGASGSGGLTVTNSFNATSNASGTYPLGTTNVVWTATDASGNTATCSQTVTVLDAQAPAVTCPATQSITLDANCSGTLGSYAGLAVPTDNCAPASGGNTVTVSGTGCTICGTSMDGTYTWSSYEYLKGSHTIRWFPNANPPQWHMGGRGAGCYDAGYVNYTPPTTTPHNVPTSGWILASGSSCSNANFTITGNVQYLTLSQTPAAGTPVSGYGPMNVVITATDPAGNQGSCNFTVNKLDQIVPTITCPPNQTIALGNDCTVAMPNYTQAATTADNCGAPTVTQSSGLSLGNALHFDGTNDRVAIPHHSSLDAGTGSFTWEAWVKSAIITPDYQLIMAKYGIPVGSTSHQNIAITPNTGKAILSVRNSANVEQFLISSTTIVDNTWHHVAGVRDVANNRMRLYVDGVLEGDAALTVTGTVASTAALHLGSFSASLGSILNGTLDEARVWNVARTQAQIQASMNSQLTGSEANLVAYYNFNHGVADGNNAGVTTLNDLATGIGGANNGTLTNFALNGSTSNWVSGQSGGGNFIGIETKTVTLTATDVAGNTATCQFTVTSADQSAPTVFCPGTQTLALDAACEAVLGNYTSITGVSDNCSTTLAQSPTSGTSVSGTGTQLVTMTAMDISGNTGTCVFTVSRIDNIAPSIVTCPADREVSLNENCQLEFPHLTTEVVATDNCTASGNLTISQNPVAGLSLSLAHGSTTVVNIGVADASGNATSCAVTLTVMDNTPPTLTCPAAQSIELTANCEATLPDYTVQAVATDNCTAAGSIALAQNPLVVNTAGTQNVTISAIDEAGNEQTCQFTLTKFDATTPTAVCNEITIDLVDRNAHTLSQAQIDAIAAGSGDNCAFTYNIPANTQFDCDDRNSSVAVTLTVTDVSGNTATCVAHVFVNDPNSVCNEPPVAVCQNISVNLDANCTASISDSAVNDGSSDPDGDALTFFVLPNTFSGVGATTVTLIVSDDEFTSNCTATVTTVDVTAPVADIASLEDVVVECSVTLDAPTATDACDGPITATTTDPTTYNAQGTYTVTWTYTDTHGNSSTQTQTVIVDDNTPLLITCPAAQTQVLGSNNCQTTLSNYTGMAVTTDNCGSVTITQSPAIGQVYNGEQIVSVTLTGTDVGGNSANCSFNVTLEDNTAPTAVCQNVTVQLDATGNGSLTAAQVNNGSSDACGIASMNINLSNFDCNNVGASSGQYQAYNTSSSVGNQSWQGELGMDFNVINPITINALGAFDNQSNGIAGTQSGGVRVAIFNRNTQLIVPGLDANISGSGDPLVSNHRIRGIAPVILPPGQYTIVAKGYSNTERNGNSQNAATSVDNGLGAIQFVGTARFAANTPTGFSYPTIIDGGPSNRYMAGTFTFSTGGQNMVTLTVTDVNSNASTCTANVTVQDNVAPVAQCKNVTVQLNASGTGATTAAAVNNGSSDACGIQGIALNTSSFNCSNLGANTVTLTATDNNGNTATCTATVTVQDNIAPTAICRNTVVALGPTGLGTITPAAVNNGSFDNCSTNYSLSTTVFNCEDVGISTVTLTVTDNSGNASSCTATVVVEDNLNPSIICPPGIQTVVLNADCSLPMPDFESALLLASDNCAYTVSQLPLPGSPLNGVGMQFVHMAATDPGGLSAVCDILIDVVDNTPPVAICQDLNISLNLDGLAGINAGMVNNGSSDGCGIHSLTLSQTAFNCSHVGNNTVTLTVKDVNNNVSTCQASVAVSDNIAPMANCNNLVIALDNNGQASISTAEVDDNSWDACGIASISINQENFDCSQVGVNPVTLTVVDVNGNTSACQAEISVLDNIMPTALCKVATVVLDGNGQGSITTASVDDGSYDNCALDYLNASPNTFTCANTGDNTVVLTVADVNGNVSTCNSIVSVQDNTHPVALCQDLTVELNVAGLGTLTAEQADAGSSDVCGIQTMDLSLTDFDCNQVGTHTAVLTVTDNNSNVSTCSLTITVVDLVAPNVVCYDITLPLDANGQASISVADLNNGSSDACGIQSLSISATAFACSQVGANNVTLTATDVNGNVSSCIGVVTVVDEIVPTAICQNKTVALNASGMSGITAAQINNGSSDNCGIQSLALSQTAFNCSHLGDNTVVLSVTDVHGNVSTCEATITVQDNIQPVALCRNLALQLDANGIGVIAPAQIDNGSSDNCGFVLSLSNSNFGCANIGVNAVTMTITDAAGNTASCQASVTVKDQVAPNPGCQDYTVLLNAQGEGCATALNVASNASDACGISSIAFLQTSDDNNKLKNGSFSSGNSYWTSTNISWNGGLKTSGGNPGSYFLLDGSGSCSSDPTLKQNVSGFYPGKTYTISGDYRGSGTSQAASFGILVDNQLITQLVNPGNTWTPFTVTFTASSSSHTITFKGEMNCDDTNYSVDNISVRKTNTVSTMCFDCDHDDDDDDDDSHGNGGADTGNHDDDDDDETLGLGEHLVTLLVTDNNGNTASCTATISVVDAVAPVAQCRNRSVTLDNDGEASISASKINDHSYDNCGVDDISLNQSNFDCSHVGANTVVLTVTDNSGNTATCTATVTVEDKKKPVISCLQNKTILLSANCTAVIPDYTNNASVYDNCNVTITQSPAPGTLLTGADAVKVTLTATDPAGNSSSADFYLYTKDLTPPTALCKNVTIELGSNGYVVVTPQMIDNGSFDACGISEMSIPYNCNNYFSCEDVGETFSITLKVKDTGGLTSSCQANVTISAGSEDSDCDGVADGCDLCPGGDDTVDNNHDGKPDCAYKPSYSSIISSWKCGNNKVYICHKTGSSGNPTNTLCVSYNSVSAHLGHGDYIGYCGNTDCDGVAGGPTGGKPGDGDNHGHTDTRDEEGEHSHLHNTAQDMLLFPNPSSNEVFIGLDGFVNKSATLRMFDQMGKQVWDFELVNAQDDMVQLRLKEMGLASGIYTVVLQSEEATIVKRLAFSRQD